MKTYKMTLILIFGLFHLLLSACGSSSWVKDATIRSYPKNNDIYAEISAYLDTGAMSLPAIQLPIFNPQQSFNELGLFSLRPSFASGISTELSIAINLTEVARLNRAGQALLPNGNPLPVAGYSSQSVLQFSVGGKSTQVYVSIDSSKGQGLIGVAVPIRQFDQLGQYAPGVNLFPTFTLGNGVRGSFGIFTGLSSGQNGFALFLDMSQLLQDPQVQTALAQVAAPSSGLSAAFAQNKLEPSAQHEPIEFYDQAPSNSKQRAIEQGLYRLHQRSTKLELY